MISNGHHPSRTVTNVAAICSRRVVSSIAEDSGSVVKGSAASMLLIDSECSFCLSDAVDSGSRLIVGINYSPALKLITHLLLVKRTGMLEDIHLLPCEFSLRGT